MLVCYLLSVGLKQAGCVGFVFPREFSSLFRVSRGQLGALLWKLCWLTLRDVIGEALLCNRRIRGSVTALAQS